MDCVMGGLEADSPMPLRLAMAGRQKKPECLKKKIPQSP